MRYRQHTERLHSFIAHSSHSFHSFPSPCCDHYSDLMVLGDISESQHALTQTSELIHILLYIPFTFLLVQRPATAWSSSARAGLVSRPLTPLRSQFSKNRSRFYSDKADGARAQSTNAAGVCLKFLRQRLFLYS